MSSLEPLVEELAATIRSGRLAPGTPLPTHRALALRHGIAVASASKVYAQLKARGLVVGEVGRGTFVRDRPLQRGWDPGDEARLSADAVDLSFNHPTWPGQAELLRNMLRGLAATGDLAALLHQQPPGGRGHERQLVADFLVRERGIAATAERTVLVNGAQQGLDIAVRALLQPHDAVAVDALEALCRRGKLRAVYAMPTLHNPLGWVLSAEQRARLVALVRRYDLLLLEDAAYAFLVPDAPPALVALAPERTVYVSSLSKSLASGLRFGFMLVPDALAHRVRASVRASHWSLPSLVTAMATRWMADGSVAQREAAMREEAHVRQAIARAVFAGLPLVAHPAALFAWLPLPAELRMDRIATALARQGIAVSKAEAYATTRHAPHALRLGLSSLAQPALREALLRVRETIECHPPP